MEEISIIGIDLAKRSFQVHRAKADEFRPWSAVCRSGAGSPDRSAWPSRRASAGSMMRFGRLLTAPLFRSGISHPI